MTRNWHGVFAPPSYDYQDRLTAVQHLDGSSVEFAKYQYAYDSGNYANGFRSSQTRTLDGATTETVYYQYDSMYRLSAAGAWDGSTIVYSYDELGNITEVKRVDNGSDTRIETYTLHGGTSPHAGMNRLASIAYDMNADGDTLDNGDYTTSFDYDQNGNMTDKDVNYVDPATPDEAWDFAYNEDDLLIEVEKDSSTVAAYRYDPLGRRMLKDDGSDVEAYFYDGEDVILEFDGTYVLREFVHGPGIDDYIAMEEASGGLAGTYFYHADGLGSVSDLTLQSDSSVQTRYEYQPFGQASVLSGAALATTNPYEYTGRRYDVESGLMYYRTRYYDTSQKRFIQEDKWPGYLIIPESYIHRTSYVLNNPLYFTDPFGKWVVGIGTEFGGAAYIPGVEVALHFCLDSNGDIFILVQADFTAGLQYGADANLSGLVGLGTMEDYAGTGYMCGGEAHPLFGGDFDVNIPSGWTRGFTKAKGWSGEANFGIGIGGGGYIGYGFGAPIHLANISEWL